MKRKGPLRGALAVLLLSGGARAAGSPRRGELHRPGEGLAAVRTGRSPPPAPSVAGPPATVRLRNPAYTVVFTPMLKVLGLPLPRPRGKDMTLIRLLIEKGVMTEEGWRAAVGAAP